MRDMAHVVTLESVIPMKNKDKIVSAVFSETAYEAIIPKEGANPGRFYCFIEADSILPEDEPQWEFLRKRCYRENLHGFLIKPMKMGEKEDGSPVRSWGLAIPVDELPITEGEKRRCKPGTDLTDALRIKKYEPVEDASPTKKNGGKFPPFIKFCFKVPFLKWIGNLYKKIHTNKGIDFPDKLISKSDETTIQNAKSFIYKFAQDSVIVTHKMEGQSCTALIDPFNKDKFYVCSRNNGYLNKIDNDFWNTAIRLDIEKGLRKLLKSEGLYYIIQAEQCGPGIQNNIYHLSDVDWFVYTIKTYNPETKICRQLSWDEMVSTCEKLNLRTVPLVGRFDRFDMIAPDVETLVKFAENAFWKIGKNHVLEFNYQPKDGEKLWTDFAQSEGVVIRSEGYDKDRNIGFSCKVKNLPYAEKGLGAISQIQWNV